MNTAQKTVPGWSKRSKGKKLKDGEDQKMLLVRTTQNFKEEKKRTNMLPTNVQIKLFQKYKQSYKKCARKCTNKCTHKNKDLNKLKCSPYIHGICQQPTYFK